MVRLLVFLISILLLPLAHANAPIAKVSVFSSGKILLDGKPADLSAIEQDFKKIKQEGGSVWYYREAAQMEPPSQAMDVIKLVIKYKLPISLSTKPDFSDYVGEDGTPHPRN